MDEMKRGRCSLLLAALLLVGGGAMAGWGASADAQLPVDPDEVVLEVATGAQWACVRTAALNVHCDGDSPYRSAEDYTGGDAIGLDGNLFSRCILRVAGDVLCSHRGGHTVDYAGVPAVQVARGWTYLCVLTVLGTVTCQGTIEEGHDDLLDPAVSITAGWYDACIVLFSGTARCMGPSAGTSAFPTTYGSGEVVDAGAGVWHTCFALDNGNVDCVYNRQYYGEAVPYTGGDAVEVEASRLHRCILLEGGNVDCHGYFYDDRRDDYEGADATDLAVGVSTNCVVREDHTATCWGGQGYAWSYP